MASRAALVEAVEASQTELEGLLRELVAFRTESQAKEATHFPDEARRCIGFVGDVLSELGFELEGWDVGPSATFPAHPLLVATRPGSGGGRSLAFKELRPQGARPAARHGAALIDDPGNSRVLLFGGTASSDAFHDTWELTLD